MNLKNMRIFAIFASLIMLTVIAMPMVGAEDESNYCNNELVKCDDIKIPTSPHREILDTPLQLIEIHPEIERSVPHPHLIIASACDDRQKLIFEAIEKYSEISEKEQEYLKEFMKYIWEKYPVTYKIVDEFYLVNEGIWQPFYEEELYKKHIDCDDVKSNYIVTLYQFDIDEDEIDAKNIKLTDAENEMLGKVWESLSRRVSVHTNHHNTEFGILWRSDVHYDMTNIAVNWLLGTHSHWFAHYAALAADDPDCMNWITHNQYVRFEETCWMEQYWFNVALHWLFNSCRASTLRKWTHAYINTDTPIGWLGGAPDEAKHFGSIARTHVNARNWNDAADNIGYASHFLTDVGQPMHTGGTLRQAIIDRSRWMECVHTVSYYNFIEDNWHQGRNFRRIVVHDNIGWWFSGANDPRNCPYYATQHLARFSNRFVDYKINSIIFNPNWRNCSTFRSSTILILIRTMRWNRGLVWYAFQG